MSNMVRVKYKYLFFSFLMVCVWPVSAKEASNILASMGMINTHYQLFYNDTRLDIVKQGLVKRSVSEQGETYGYGYREWFLEVMYKNKGNYVSSAQISGISFLNKANEVLYIDDDFPLVTNFFLPENKIEHAGWYFLAINLEDVPFVILDDVDIIRLSGQVSKEEASITLPTEKQEQALVGEVL